MAPATAAEVTLRPLTAGDTEGAVEVLVRAFNEFNAAAGLSPMFATFSQARATVQMALALDPRGAWGAVWRERKVVGVAISYRRGAYVSVGPVAVHPNWQGQGVGRLLVRRLHQEHPDAACFVLVHAGANARAFTLYRTEGYRVVYPEATFVGVPRSLPPAPTGVGEGGLEQVAALDRELACVDRSAELRALLRLGRALVREDGYVVCVRVGGSLAVGPGAARTPEAMQALVGAALHLAPPGGVIARAPAHGAAFEALVDAGMVPEGVGNLMVRGAWLPRTGEHLHPVFPEVL